MKRRFAVLPVFFVLGVLAAWTLGPSSRAEPDLRIILTNDFFTLDPARMSYSHDLRLSYAIYDTLVRFDNLGDFSVVPAVAERWTISDDQRTYTFFLREGAKWSNGDPVTAHDFVEAWKRMLFPETVADYVGLLFDIRGAKDFYGWRTAQTAAYAERGGAERNAQAAQQLFAEANTRFRETVAINAVDDHTLQIELNQPVPYFLDLCAFGALNPVHRATIESHSRLNPDSGLVEMDFEWTKPGVIVTNGPYMPTEWRFKRGMRLEPNPHFYDPDTVKSKIIDFIPINDQNTGVLAWKTGTADWMWDATVPYLAELKEAHESGDFPGLEIVPAFGTYFWSFNCRPELVNGDPNPLADPRVRKALALAVNKQLLVDAVKRTGERTSTTFIPPGSIAGYPSPAGLGYNPELAKQMLIKAGWEDRNGDGIPENENGEDFPTIDLLYSTLSYHEDIALSMGTMWKKALGISTQLVGKESKVYKDDIVNGNFMMARGGWFGDYGDPTTFLDLHRKENGNNTRKFYDSEFESLMEQAAVETDPHRRMELLAQAEAITVQEQFPILPLWTYTRPMLFLTPEELAANKDLDRNAVTGISTHPRLVTYLHKVEVISRDELEPMENPAQ
ncbi:MAG: peptide ABC transporter substrate-binding protein [Planctomycetota bacterium]